MVTMPCFLPNHSRGFYGFIDSFTAPTAKVREKIDVAIFTKIIASIRINFSTKWCKA